MCHSKSTAAANVAAISADSTWLGHQHLAGVLGMNNLCVCRLACFLIKKKKAGLEHIASPQALKVADRKKWAKSLKQQQQSPCELAAISMSEQTVATKPLPTHRNGRS